MNFLAKALAILNIGVSLINAQQVNNFPYLNRTVINQPERGVEELIYPRYVELLDGTILVTVSQRLYAGNPQGVLNYFPVFSSTDGGASWDWVSNITDQVNGWGLTAQPALLELTQPYGNYDTGTILAAGNSWSENGTHIDVYASLDKGSSWNFVSNVAIGTAPNTTNGAHPIWEPFLM